MVRKGEVYLIDTRPLVEYENGHLSAAVSIPVDELPSRLDELPPVRDWSTSHSGGPRRIVRQDLKVKKTT